ncbi:hypothetical protein [Afipia sp. Root123D2]|uniref:hypothetical protein n=1 Tax=Afipia sp. Root123D2 TaxID=1736436 RepID=UPI000B0DB3FC|nr:hypothetical protein [Afipia sp. Root123D2]
MGAEQAFDRLFAVLALKTQDILVDQEREPIIRHQTVIAENEGERLGVVVDRHHHHAYNNAVLTMAFRELVTIADQRIKEVALGR